MARLPERKCPRCTSILQRIYKHQQKAGANRFQYVPIGFMCPVCRQDMIILDDEQSLAQNIMHGLKGLRLDPAGIKVLNEFSHKLMPFFLVHDQSFYISKFTKADWDHWRILSKKYFDEKNPLHKEFALLDLFQIILDREANNG